MDESIIRLDAYADLTKALVDLEVVRTKIFKKCTDNGMNLDKASKLVNEIQESAQKMVETLPIHI